MNNDCAVSVCESESPFSDEEFRLGAPRKWPFLEMDVGQVIKVTQGENFASAKASVMYAKKTKGYRIRTKMKDGILYVKRFA